MVQSLIFVSVLESGFEILADSFVGQGIVLKIACNELVVACHVDQTVTREIEQDDLLLAGFDALPGLANGGCDGMARLGSRDDAFGSCEERTGLKRFELRYVHAFHVAVLDQLRHDYACAMIAETARMYVGRFEVMSQREHGQQRRIACLIAEVVTEHAARQFGT